MSSCLAGREVVRASRGGPDLAAARSRGALSDTWVPFDDEADEGEERGLTSVMVARGGRRRREERVPSRVGERWCRCDETVVSCARRTRRQRWGETSGTSKDGRAARRETAIRWLGGGLDEFGLAARSIFWGKCGIGGLERKRELRSRPSRAAIRAKRRPADWPAKWLPSRALRVQALPRRPDRLVSVGAALPSRSARAHASALARSLAAEGVTENRQLLPVPAPRLYTKVLHAQPA